MRTTRQLSILATVLAFGFTLAGPALAQERPAPEWRVDVGVPSVGVGTATDAGNAGNAMLAVGVHVALAHRSGHGFSIAGEYTTSSLFFGAGRSSALIDADYRYRFRLLGDDRVGIGLDLGAGLSGGEVEGHGSRNCFWGCADVEPTPAPPVSNGAHLGSNLDASLDLRLSVFYVGVRARARALVALEPTAGHSAVQADVTGSLYLGFGFY